MNRMDQGVYDILPSEAVDGAERGRIPLVSIDKNFPCYSFSPSLDGDLENVSALTDAKAVLE
jgi:hypothetical protein